MGTLRYHHRLILIGSLALVLVLYVFSYWLPHRRQMGELHQKIQDMQQEVSRVSERASQLPLLHGELAQLAAYNQVMAERIPPTLNVKEFLATVHNLGQQEGVTVTRVTPQIQSDVLDLQQQPVRLWLEGAFSAFTRVIYKLERANRLIEITHLDVKRPQKPGESADWVEAQVEIKLFACPATSDSPSESNE